MHVVERREAHAAFAGFFRLARIDAGFRRVIEHDVVDGRAFRRLVLQQFVRVLGQRLVAGLRDAPGRLDVACRRRAAQKVIHAGERRARQDFFRRIAEVHRVERDAFVRLRVHLLVERRALEERDAVLLPFFVRRRCELIERHIGEIRLCFCLLQDFLKIQLFFHCSSSFGNQDRKKPPERLNLPSG